MTSERIKEVHETRPFRPFTLYMADGTKITVNHPEFMARSKSGRTVVVVDEKTDSHRIIDLLLVTQISIESESRRQKRRAS